MPIHRTYIESHRIPRREGRSEAVKRQPRDSSLRGFSLIELLVVVSFIMILSGLSVEFVMRGIRATRLRGTVGSYANLLQKARIQAVHGDKAYTVRAVSATGNTPAMAFVDVAGTGSFVPVTDSMALFQTDIVPMPFASGPNLADLESKFLPADPNAALAVVATAVGPTFGPRGLPCTPAGAGPTSACPYLSPAGIPSAFITFFQNSQSGEWGAVTVTPSSRIRLWSYQSGRWVGLN